MPKEDNNLISGTLGFEERPGILPVDYIEESKPIGGVGGHFLDQLSATKIWDGDGVANLEVSLIDGRTPLFCTINIYQLDEIDGDMGRFTAKLRLYFIWQSGFGHG